jgi:prepilin-type N-terminal cleavage/methylation domain-containing protein
VRRGFTLTELLVTLAVVVILLSLSVGILSRLGQKEELVAVHQAVRGLLRRARNAAREERYRVTVTIDTEASEVRAQQKTSVTQFRFEDPGAAAGPEGGNAGEHDATTGPDADATRDERDAAVIRIAGARSYELVAEDADRARGKIGLGLLFEKNNRAGAAWGYVDHRPALAPVEGIHVSCWIYPGLLSRRLYERKSQEERQEGHENYKRSGEDPREAPARLRDYAEHDPPLFYVFRKGKAYSLALTANYELEAAVTGPDEGGAEVTWISRTRGHALRANRWYRVELSFDGRLLRVIVNGIPRAHRPLDANARLPVRLQTNRAVFSVSDPDPRRAFFGVIDELKIAAIVSSVRVPIPPDVAIIAPTKTLRFDMLGQLDPAKHAEPFVLYLCNAPDVDEILDPKPAGQTTDTKRTRTREQDRKAAEEKQKAKILIGQNRFQRFGKNLANAQERQVRRLVVGRTGLVSD